MGASGSKAGGNKARGARPGEQELIARYFAPLASDKGARGLRDDAASLSPLPGTDLVLTTDAVIAGVHFAPDADAALVARKALRVNLSDLAAKGAAPVGYLMTLALHDDWTVDWLERFVGGLAEDQAQFGCSLLGGDTVRTPGPLSISIMAVGALPTGSLVARDTSKAGQRIVVSGTIGDAALGLLLRGDNTAAKRLGLAPDDIPYLTGRLDLPRPRLELADAVRTHAGAAMDVSDGLIGDLEKMCVASGVGARIEIARVPLSSAAQKAVETDASELERLLTGGDDYEILAGVDADKCAAFLDAASAAGIAVREIGAFVSGSGVTAVGADGEAMTFAHGGYAHF